MREALALDSFSDRSQVSSRCARVSRQSRVCPRRLLMPTCDEALRLGGQRSGMSSVICRPDEGKLSAERARAKWDGLRGGTG